MDDYKWDFDDDQDKALSAMVQESEAKKEDPNKLSVVHLKKRKEDGEQASASRKSSIASIEPWDSQNRKTSRQEEEKSEKTTGRFSVDKQK